MDTKYTHTNLLDVHMYIFHFCDFESINPHNRCLVCIYVQQIMSREVDLTGNTRL
jgi:hypothetical protein